MKNSVVKYLIIFSVSELRRKIDIQHFLVVSITAKLLTSKNVISVPYIELYVEFSSLDFCPIDFVFEIKCCIGEKKRFFDHSPHICDRQVMRTIFVHERGFFEKFHFCKNFSIFCKFAKTLLFYAPSATTKNFVSKIYKIHFFNLFTLN